MKLLKPLQVYYLLKFHMTDSNESISELILNSVIIQRLGSISSNNSSGTALD